MFEKIQRSEKQNEQHCTTNPYLLVFLRTQNLNYNDSKVFLNCQENFHWGPDSIKL